MGLDADADLIRAWKRGDRAAFERLVRTWEGRMGRFLARLTGCPETAGDLSQEVFLRVYLARDRYADDGRFGMWIYRIALNLARDAARRARPPAPLADFEPSSPAADRAEYVAERQEIAALVAGALSDLPAPLREVVVLRHYECLSFEEMGRLLATPATTLKSRFAVALRRLHDSLAARGLRPEDSP
jgi:RNA polymerase sigma-70 factor (ECF subfamily)